MLGKTLGNFRVTSELGAGGMGIVFVGEHILIGHRVAIKVVRPEQSTEPDLVLRFFNEARAAAHLHDPGIADIYDFGYDDQGAAYMVMELLQGESLRARLERERTLTALHIVSIGRQVAQTLSAVHQSGIVHRDLKPENLFLVPDATAPDDVRVKVLDFGIAKLWERLPESLELRSVNTDTGVLLGSPAYMAPEYARGARTVDPRTDVYSLACILYEMAAGHVPFERSTTADVLTAQVADRPPPLPASVPPKLVAAIEKGMAKRPEARHQSMDELLAGLCDEDSGPRITPTAPTRRTDRHGGPLPARPEAPVAAALRRGEGPRRPVALVLAFGAGAALTAAVVGGHPTRPNGPNVASAQVQKDPATAGPPAQAAAPPAVGSTTAAEPASSTVRVMINSSPTGAEVYRGSDGMLLGKTPYEGRVDPELGPVVYALHHDGFVTQRVKLLPTHDVHADVGLTPAPKSRPRKGAEESYDPFNDSFH
jgi:serine/threonine-protein kinase